MSPFGDEPYYIYLGALVSYKRVDLAVEVCRTLGKNLLVIGSGSEFKKLKEFSGDKIKFITNADDKLVKQALSNAKALLFPGEEDFGIVVLEAMACQTPVIAYRIGGAIDTVTEHTGLFF